MKPLRSDRKYKIEDNIGKRFGSRIVLGQAPRRNGDNQQRWFTKCDCGNVAAASPYFLFKSRCLQCLECTKRQQTGSGHPFWSGGKHTPLTHFNKFKNSAKRRGMEFDLSISDIDELYERQGMLCALSGVPIQFDNGNKNGVARGNASLDRIDSAKGYIPGNVQLVTKNINMGKQTLTDAEFISMCRAVVAYADRNGYG